MKQIDASSSQNLRDSDYHIGEGDSLSVNMTGQ